MNICDNQESPSIIQVKKPRQSEADKEKDRTKDNRWFDSISKFEKIFWAMILLFIVMFIILNFLAIKNTSQDENDDRGPTTVTQEWTDILIPIDTININLKSYEETIKQNINNELNTIYSVVDREIDNLFYLIENNVDNFLDFHYSVIGEYIELGSAVTGTIEKTIEDKILGKDFTERLKLSSQFIDKSYEQSINNHLSEIKKYALENVDADLNIQPLSNLHTDIGNIQLFQQGKVGVLIAARLGPKVVQMISAKLAAKTTAKIAAKVAAKLAAKTTASASGAAGGVFCGPFVWVCAPVAAGVLWVATDIAFVAGNEYFNRDEFKREIMLSLENNKEALKSSYKQEYYQAFHNLSKKVLDEYKNTPVQKRERVKVGDKYRHE